jgi:cobalt-zinc-cadmium efflux system protein
MEKHERHGGGATGHHMMPSMAEGDTRALKITTWLTGIYFVIEMGIGIYTGSIAVISDAFHTFSAVGGVLLALVAGKIAIRPADRFKTFGLMRAEIVGALINGLFLLIMAIIVLWMGYHRLQNPIDLPTTPMLIAAFGGLITEAISIKLLYTGQKTSLNIKGAFWHVLQTFVGSLIIIIAALVIRFTGFLAIDPILGMLFGLILIYASWGIIRDSLNILLETVPADVDLQEVKESLESITGVENAHHMHAWVITSGKNIFSTHIQVSDQSKSQDILKEAHEILKDKFNFYFSTLQIEDECTDSGEAMDIDIFRE